MNDNRTTTGEPFARSSRRWFQRPIVWVVGVLIASAVWFIIPSSSSAGGIRFTVHHTGSPGVLTFVVRDSRGQPLPGVTVMSESSSGTTPEFTTDTSGIATIVPGESEVLAVFIQGREFRFRPRGFLEHFAPDCSGGLTFHVSIRDDRNA